MRENAPRLLVGVALVAVVAGFVYWMSAEPSHAPRVDQLSDAGTRDASPSDDAGDASVGSEDADDWLAPALGDGDVVAIVDGEPVKATFVLGAAGVYPPVEHTGPSVGLPIPAEPISGALVDTIEAWVRTESGATAFWGEVSVDASAIELVPARSLVVRVTNEAGQPIEGASVRLARSELGLVVRSANTDDAGVATFDACPLMDLTVRVDHPGYAAVSLTAQPGEHDVALASGRAVTGHVVDADGRKLAGVLVAIHAGSTADDVFQSAPADIIETDMLGTFRSASVTGDFIAARVVSAEHPVSRSPVVDAAASDGLVRLEISVQPGLVVRVLVTQPNGEPVPDAIVRWEAPELGVGNARMSSRDGRAVFRGVPNAAAFVAEKGPFLSETVVLPPESAGSVDITLRLDVADGRLWRYRLQMPDGVVAKRLDVTDSAGALCDVEFKDHRDFTLTGCGAGSPRFELRTNVGTAVWTTPKFEDGATVTAPRPSQVTLRVAGAEDEPWGDTEFGLHAAQANVVELSVEDEEPGRVLRGKAYPGEYSLVVSNHRVGVQRFLVLVDEKGADERFELAALKRIRMHVVDRYGSPVTGAYLMLFDGPELVDVARSSGQLPAEFVVRPPFEGAVLAVDARRGEGILAINTAEIEGKQRIMLRERVLNYRVPNRRPDVEEMSDLLEARLVEADSGYLIEPDGAASAASKAGFRRGDWIITAWPAERRHHVIVFRRGTGYVDSFVP